MLQPPEHSKRKQPPTKKPPIPHSNYKPSAAKRTRKAFAQLIAVLTKEWPVRSLNLGVKSGTGVIEEVLWSQLHTLAAAVHLLAVQDVEASRVLVGMASRLQQQQPAVFQNLQVRCWGAPTGWGGVARVLVWFENCLTFLNAATHSCTHHAICTCVCRCCWMCWV